jgi:hypothetical protein
VNEMQIIKTGTHTIVKRILAFYEEQKIKNFSPSVLIHNLKLKTRFLFDFAGFRISLSLSRNV